MRIKMSRKLLTVGLVWSLFVLASEAMAGELLVGTASTDITPSEPVALSGQFGLRISEKPATPITANVIALESRQGDRSLDAAIMVSCDLVGVSDVLLDKVHQAVQKRLPDFDLKKLFLNATHTHTAPVVTPDVYDIPKTGVIQVDAYCAFAAERIAEAIEKAWMVRKPGSFTWGLGHAAVAENRRATYADGHAQMYGNTNQPDFLGLEGYEDHDVGSLFFWNEAGNLIAIAVNVACPSQEVESDSIANADFWHPIRESLRKRYGPDVCVLGWTGAAGDLSPHLMYRKNAEERMRELRKLTRLEEIARRIVAAVDETFDAVKDDRHADVPLIHKVETLQLPMRRVTDAEYAEVKALVAAEKPSQMANTWHGRVLDRYERQKTDPRPVCGTNIHVLRIGDVVICTNPFEMFADYAVRMKARSRAAQTFVIQLVAGGPASYLPTERAVRGGGYSAIVQSNDIGPEGGQILVDRTVELIDSMWANPNQETK
jgi:hypothetical protein